MVLKGAVNVQIAFVTIKDKYGISDFRMVQELAGQAGDERMAGTNDFIGAELLKNDV